jgi:hypothetical protein
VLAALAALAAVPRARAQDLGHKIPGLIGLDAGRAPEPGLYLLDRVAGYSADRVRDRHGQEVPVQDLRLRAVANGAGLAVAIELPWARTVMSAAVAVPYAHLSLDVRIPETSIDKLGVGDVYLMPIELGWGRDHFDIVASYDLYMPTEKFTLESGEGVSHGHITHEFAAGGTLATDRDRSFFASALASYELNMRKDGVDITRGDTFQIQGGVGGSLFGGRVEAGLAGYALWQVRADRGADLPDVLRGARDRVFGLGPEIAVLLAPLPAQIRVRYERDLGVRSRPEGQIIVIGLGLVLWRPHAAER